MGLLYREIKDAAYAIHCRLLQEAAACSGVPRPDSITVQERSSLLCPFAPQVINSQLKDWVRYMIARHYRRFAEAALLYIVVASYLL